MKKLLGIIQTVGNPGSDQGAYLTSVLRLLCEENGGKWKGTVEKLAFWLELGVVKSREAFVVRLEKCRESLKKNGISLSIKDGQVELLKQKEGGW